MPEAFRAGVQRLGEYGGLGSTALAFGIMLAAGLAAERLVGLRRRARPGPGADGDIGARLAQLLLGFARDLAGLLVFAVVALAVMLLAGGRGQMMPAVLLTYLGAVVIVRLVYPRLPGPAGTRRPDPAAVRDR